MKKGFVIINVISLLSLFLAGCNTPSEISLDIKVSSSVSSDFSSESSLSSAPSSLDSWDKDPYTNISFSSFYASYKPATCYKDSYYRSLHGFMSGSLEVPSQYPETASNQPMTNDTYIRNSSTYYASEQMSYSIVDSTGNIVNTIYYGGAYITLEEVAAYVYAFGDVPINYTSSTSASPSSSIWGKYLRLNHNYFSDDVTNYLYEPILPNAYNTASLTDGTMCYYEIDIGTTGTTCGTSSQNNKLYNTGSKISRGAARIVYTRYYRDSTNVGDCNLRHVFYTYNHYNDFQEYLNYSGGWGKRFGNISGGGTYNNGTSEYVTSYPLTAQTDFN